MHKTGGSAMVLILEEVNKSSLAMQRLLENEGRIPFYFTDGMAAYESIKERLYSLFWINLDAGGEALSGWELLQLLKQVSPRTPTLVTANDQSREGVLRAYEMGCDEFFKAPVYPEELIYRLRRLMGEDNSTALPGDLNYHPDEGRLVGKEGEIALTDTEHRLLHLLVQNLGRAVPVNLVEEMLWDEYVSDACRHTLVSRVRKKLGKDLIRTLPRVGYMIDSRGE